MDWPTIIDVEASGFGRGSYPIEVGIARADGSVASRLICPEPSWQHWNEGAEAVHGISRDQLLAEGSAVIDVADWLNSELKGLTVYSDSWGFDSSWLALLFHHADRVQRFRLDTLHRLLSEQQVLCWGQAKQQVVAELGLTRHRAADDAQMLQRTFQLTSRA